MKNIFIPLKFDGFSSDQVSQLVRVMEMDDQALPILRSNVETSHKEIQLLHSQNALLTQQLVDCMCSSLEEVSKSFENSLDQVHYFHHPLTLSREKIWLNQTVIDGKIVC